MTGIFHFELGEAIGWSRWDSVCSGKQHELESSRVVLKDSKTRECSGALTSTEDNVCKMAAYALAQSATQRKVPTEVIVRSKFQVVIIYSSECNTTTKFTWLYLCSYKPQSLREKGPWGSFAKLEVGGDGLNEFPKTCLLWWERLTEILDKHAELWKKRYRASTIFQNLPESEVLSFSNSSTCYELIPWKYHSLLFFRYV